MSNLKSFSSTEEFEPHCFACRNPFTTIKCSDCFKTYHEKCIKSDSFEIIESNTTTFNDVRLKRKVAFKIGLCVECKTSGTASNLFAPEELRNVLLKLCRELQLDFPYYRDLTEMTNVVYPMDTKTLWNNIENTKYCNVEGFLSDVSWIYHNITVYADSEKEGKTYYEILTGARQFTKRCQEDINDIKVCHGCFPRWTAFNTVCKRPHLLVWVSGASYPCWPAKAFRITEKKKKKLVLVKFFGDKSKAEVDISKCHLYNEKTFVNAGVTDSIKECEEYKRSLETNFGRVKLPPKDRREILLPDLAKNISEMFPDCADRRTTSKKN